MPSPEIGTLFNVSPMTIRRILEQSGIDRRGRSKASRRFQVNEDSFATITPESAYWIGFLMADGCIATENHLQVELRERDKSHLEKLRTFLKSDHPLRQPPSLKLRRAWRYGVRSEKIISDLMKYGIVRRKSLTCKVIGLETNRNFWRGVIDGDGCIYLNPRRGYWFLTVCGSKPLMKQYLSFIMSITPTKAGLLPQKNIWRVSLGGYHSAEILHFLYYNSCISLNRNMEKASTLFS